MALRRLRHLDAVERRAHHRVASIDCAAERPPGDLHSRVFAEARVSESR